MKSKLLIAALLIATNVYAQAPRPPVDKLSLMRDVNLSGLASGQLIKWNGTAFVPIGTTAGENILSLTNPSAITFLQVNADNTASLLSPSALRTALGVGLDSGIVHNTGTETITGTKTFSTMPVIPDAGITNAKLANSSITIAGHSVSLGGTQTISASDVGAQPHSTILDTFVTNSGTLPGEVSIITAQGVVTKFKSSANTSTARGTALTAAIAAESAGDFIVVGSGDYDVSPIELKAGMNLSSVAGQNSTTLRLKVQTAGSGIGSANKWSVIWGFSAATTSGVHINGFTFDCNLANQPSASVAGAVSIYGGSNSSIDNCRAINWGTETSTENFVFIIQNFVGQGICANNRISNCVVETAAAVSHGSGETTAFDISGDAGGGDATNVSDGWQLNPVITGCSVQNIVSGGSTGQVHGIHCYTIGCSLGGRVSENFAYNLTGPDADPYKDIVGFYIDTWSARSLTVDGNVFLNIAKGIWNAGASGYTYDNWVISNNHIDLNTSADGNYGIVGDGAGTYSGWLVLNNIVNSSFANPMGALPTGTVQLYNAKSNGTLIGSPKSGRVYRALLSQSGTSAPVATVLENSLGGTVVWSYTDVGIYSGTLTGAFTSGKTFLVAGTIPQIPSSVLFYRTSADVVTLESGDGSVDQNAFLAGTAVEIRVYP